MFAKSKYCTEICSISTHKNGAESCKNQVCVKSNSGLFSCFLSIPVL